MNKSDKYDHESFGKRLKIGKGAEQKCVKYLNENCGFNLIPTTKEDDLRGIDFTDGATRYQVKVRTGKYQDLIFCIYQPYYGLDHKETKIGRDIKGDYNGYICQCNQTIYVIRNTTQLKKIIKEIEKGWEGEEYKFDGRGWFKSCRHKDCSLKYHVDRHNHIPKVLAFVSPKLLEKETYEM